MNVLFHIILQINFFFVESIVLQDIFKQVIKISTNYKHVQIQVTK